MSEEIRIGWGTRDISTKEPTSIHGQFHLRISKGILDPITVTALAIESNGEQLIMLSCDITGFTGRIVGMIRERVRELAPDIDAAKVIMNATHTHCTGDVNGIGMATTGVDFPVPPTMPFQKPGEYSIFFVEKCAEAIADAWNSRRQGALAWGYGYAAVSHSRKTWFLDDLSKRVEANMGGTSGMAVNGHASMYGNTADPMFSHYEAGAEHQINFLYTFDQNNALTGAVINLPCPSQCSENLEMLTADYWHDVRLLLRERHGNIGILPQCAPAGDLSPHILHYKKAQERRLKFKYGPAEEAYREQYNRKDIAEKIGAAFEDVLAWASKDIRRTVKLQNSVETLQLERRQPKEGEYENERTILAELNATPFQTTGTDKDQLRVNSVLAARRQRSKDFIEKCEIAMRGETYPCDLHVASMDDIAFVTSPFELYSDFMHRIIGRSPFIQTFNIQLADNQSLPGGACYLATERGVEGGGYSSSRYCNAVSPKGGQQLVEATLTRLEKLNQNLYMEKAMEKLAIYGGAPVIRPEEVKNWPPVDKTDEELIIEALHEPCQTRGNFTKQIEKEFCEYNGNKFAYFTNCGGSALQMCIAGCGIGAGDQVIVTSYTWPSSATCIIHNMAVPVFVDIDPETFLIDPAKIEAAITPRTKAILVVHLHGLCCDMDPIWEIAKKHNLKIIEDACQAHDALYKGRKAGTLGDCAAFSFNQNKCMTSGEGGIFVTDNEEIFNKGLTLARFGDMQPTKDTDEFPAYAFGHKFCNNEITAAYALAELRKFPTYYKHLIANATTLHAALKKMNIKGLKLPYEPENCKHNWYNYNLRVDFDAIGMGSRTDEQKGRFRDAICAALHAEGVICCVWQRCILPQMTIFRAKNAYGKGYPWTVPGADDGVSYDLSNFPAALAYCKAHISIVQILRSPNDTSMAERVALAIKKVFDNLDAINPDEILK